MMKKDLEQYRHLGKEIKLYQSQKKDKHHSLADYEQAAYTVEGSMTQFPFSKRCITVGCRLGFEDEQEKEIKELTEKIIALQSRRQAIREYIANIKDSELRQVFTLRYLAGARKMQWNEVAKKMGEGYTAESLKQRVHRYFRNL